MAIKKSELYSSLWKGCDELRGGMDASQYKNYVLVLLFVRYVSDKGKRKGTPIVIPKGGSFRDMVALKGKVGIGDGMNKIISKLAEANALKGIIDDAVDFNDSEKLGSGKEMQDRLSNLISIFQDEALDLSKNKAEGDDLLGDAYEYLMRHFSIESGKSKGQFYTPAEVSRVMAKVIGISNAYRRDHTIYDPTCGSGSLLLKAAQETPRGITIYGQENDNATKALAIMNMWLHENPSAVIKNGNSLSNPYFTNKEGGLRTFDFVVANPPFSTKSWSNGMNQDDDKFGRFDGYGIPPKKNGDYAFLLHIIKSLKSTGKGAVILPHGVLFRGNAEAEIRENIIKRGYIKGIISLPPNLFYGTSIPACIIVLDKENAQSRKGIFMIDASQGFYKDGNKNRLRERDIHKIVDVFTKQIDIAKYSRMVSIAEIANKNNNFNLNISRYIDTQTDDDRHDILGHLNGEIPNSDIDDLCMYWKVYPNIKQALFIQKDKYSSLKIKTLEINQTVFDHVEFKTYSKKIEKVFLDWKTKHVTILKAIKIGAKPKELIFKISENLLDTFSKVDLVDKYAIYQHLMNYWTETMQDDVFIIGTNGWSTTNTIKYSDGEKWESNLVPKNVLINRYFLKQNNNLNEMQIKLENIKQQMQILEDDEVDDLLSESKTDSGNVTKRELVNRIKKIKNDSEFVDELRVLLKYQKLMNEYAVLKKQINETKIMLDKKLLLKYKSLTKNQLKTLIIEDKWMKVLHDLIHDEMDKISYNLTTRIVELAKRYETPLPVLSKNVDKLRTKIVGHLLELGFKWK